MCHVYRMFSGSEKILFDNGTEFKNKFEEITKQLVVEYKAYNHPYMPQCNDKLEGFHKFIYLKSCS